MKRARSREGVRLGPPGPQPSDLVTMPRASPGGFWQTVHPNAAGEFQQGTVPGAASARPPPGRLLSYP